MNFYKVNFRERKQNIFKDKVSFEVKLNFTKQKRNLQSLYRLWKEFSVAPQNPLFTGKRSIDSFI